MLTLGDQVIDRRTGERLRFSKLMQHNWLGTVATCIRPGATGTAGRIRLVPLDALYKPKRKRPRCGLTTQGQ